MCFEVDGLSVGRTTVGERSGVVEVVLEQRREAGGEGREALTNGLGGGSSFRGAGIGVGDRRGRGIMVMLGGFLLKTSIIIAIVSYSKLTHSSSVF